METQGNHHQQGPKQLRLVDGGVGRGLTEQRLDTTNGDESPLMRIAAALERIADHLAPEPADIVGTDYLARKWGCTPTHVARFAHDNSIPASCVVPGCGDGKPWKFFREQIDQWLATR